MLKIRIMGLPEEIESMVAKLTEQFEVYSVSAPYSNRGDTKYVRVYVELKEKTKYEC